jgi:large subunit ribosomal protein L3
MLNKKVLMRQGLQGIKLGCTQMFDEKIGRIIPLTVLQIAKHNIIKKAPSGNYISVIEGIGSKKKLKKRAFRGAIASLTGNTEKPTSPCIIKEVDIDQFRFQENHITENNVIGAESFLSFDKVDVLGTSKGKGFSGVMKRYNFSGQRASHGNTKSTRKGGSYGSGKQDIGRVNPGTKMPGVHGCYSITKIGLKVEKVSGNLLFIRGSVAGPNKSQIMVSPSIKAKKV